nr:peptide chain release factor N(5)-glutamine methyltransferase [uncultured Trichococcus sp.]
MGQSKELSYQQALQNGVLFLEQNEKSPLAAERLLLDRLGWTKTDLLMHFADPITDQEYNQYLSDIKEYVAGKPIQYIVGVEWFYGYPLKVTEATLIPRPETEELVQRALQCLEGKGPQKVLDIGTGSGAIAIAMKKERPQDEVSATDLSEEALAVAKENAKQLDADIRFLQGDLLEPVQLETFDCILSNPPYISEDEISLMDRSVLEYEPHSALFADHDGLDLYQKMAFTLPFHLKTDGCLFMEIGFNQGEKLLELYKKAFPDKTVTIEKDLSGLDRMLIVK